MAQISKELSDLIKMLLYRDPLRMPEYGEQEEYAEINETPTAYKEILSPFIFQGEHKNSSRLKNQKA